MNDNPTLPYPSKKRRNLIRSMKRRIEWLTSEERIKTRSENARNWDLVEIAAVEFALRALRWVEENGHWSAMEADLAKDQRPGVEYDPTPPAATGDDPPPRQPVEAPRGEVDGLRAV